MNSPDRHLQDRFFLLGWVAASTVLASLLGCVAAPLPLTLKSATAEDVLTAVAGHQGREAVLVNYWGTWCVPCVEEFPMIVELGKTYSGRGLVTYFVSVDWPEDTDKVMAFLKRQGVAGLSFIKDQGDNPFINGINLEWSGAVPFTIVYHQQSGGMVDFWEGKASREKFEGAIQAALMR